MDELKIVLDGVEHIAPTPKARVWRKIMEFDGQDKDLAAPDFLEKYAAIIADAFGDDVTADMILDSLDIDEILVMYRNTVHWVLGLLHRKLDELPKNAETANG
jgi:hypothetical protein